MKLLRVAVTGASGFVGRHVLRELVSRKVDVYAITRSAETLSEFQPVVNIVELDIERPISDTYAKLGKPDVLIHLAWGGLPNYKSFHHFERELPVQYQFLKSAVKAGLKNLVVTGTCFEYGMLSGPLDEKRETQPANPYGFAKDTLRRQLDYLKEAEPFSLTWARLFYIYGDGQGSGAIMSQLKDTVERGEKIFNMSGGEQLRDYLPVEEAADILVRLSLSSADNGIVNVCSGQPISIRRLVEGWVAEHNWRVELNLGHYPYPDYEPMAFWGDRRKLDRVLGSD